MTYTEKQKKLDELMLIGTKINEIKSPMQAMETFIKEYGDFIQRVWDEGYTIGYKKGKQQLIDIKKN